MEKRYLGVWTALQQREGRQVIDTVHLRTMHHGNGVIPRCVCQSGPHLRMPRVLPIASLAHNRYSGKRTMLSVQGLEPPAPICTQISLAQHLPDTSSCSCLLLEGACVCVSLLASPEQPNSTVGILICSQPMGGS